ncbi:MAG: GTP 3',8-cyclase MoaA [Clostridiales bacterium]|nr:GTP 3',8-cyclase MoaA [Clostridiales bacterium]
MRDKLGREIEYLRLSVTENCNLHCIYCNPDSCEKGCEYKAGLSPEEMGRIVSIMAKLGVHKVRITGGEPLVRSDIIEVIRQVASVPGIDDLSMTTNGIKLAEKAKSLKDAGLGRLSISLDSLREDRFSHITGGGRLKDVMKGIETAVEVGLCPVRINVVLIKGVNDDEIPDFVEFTKNRPVDVRFIELMPVGDFGENNRDKVVLNSDILKSLPELVRCNDKVNGQPARYYRMDGHMGKIGFISPLSHKFCDSCNRIRLTCDGKIKPCLGNNSETDIMGALNGDQEELDMLIRQAILNKPAGHCFEDEFTSLRAMNGIGG